MILPIILALARGSRPVRLTRSHALHPASLALWGVGVLPVDENQRCENSHVKAKSRLLTIPGLRLPHLKPLAADDQKPERTTPRNPSAAPIWTSRLARLKRAASE